ncbi:MAG: nucleotidyltransferase [Anaerolineaceae bacterium]|nr:nucleotidyltransferase [Anaerolineaceae bacterium]
MAGPQLVVMAAGIGSRYGGLKQVDPIGPSGEIVIDYSVYDARKAGFRKVVFIIRKEIEEIFREKVGRSIELQIDTQYVFQELDALPPGFAVPAGRSKPWGTGHAVLAARGAVTDNCAVINADDYYGPGSFKVLADHLAGAADSGGVYDYSMVAFRLHNTVTEHGHVARGVCTANPDGTLATIVERTRIETCDGGIHFSEDSGVTWTDIDPRSLVSMNMWGFTPSVFEELAARLPAFLEASAGDPKAEYFLPTVVNDLVQQGQARVRVLPTDEKWYGVTYQQDKPELKSFIRDQVARGRYPQKLWS